SYVAYDDQRESRIGNNIVIQVMSQAAVAVAAFSVFSGIMAHLHIDDPVGGLHQKIADLGQMNVHSKDGVNNETAHQAEAGDFQVWILFQHFGSCINGYFRSKLPDQIVMAVLVFGDDDID